MLNSNNDDKKFNYRLKYVMAVRGYSQSDVAKLSNIDSSMISRMISGQYEPNLSTLKRLVKGLQCNCDFLLGTSNSLQFKK